MPLNTPNAYSDSNAFDCTHGAQLQNQTPYYLPTHGSGSYHQWHISTAQLQNITPHPPPTDAPGNYHQGQAPTAQFQNHTLRYPPLHTPENYHQWQVSNANPGACQKNCTESINQLMHAQHCNSRETATPENVHSIDETQRGPEITCYLSDGNIEQSLDDHFKKSLAHLRHKVPEINVVKSVNDHFKKSLGHLFYEFLGDDSELLTEVREGSSNTDDAVSAMAEVTAPSTDVVHNQLPEGDMEKSLNDPYINLLFPSTFHELNQLLDNKVNLIVNEIDWI